MLIWMSKWLGHIFPFDFWYPSEKVRKKRRNIMREGTNWRKYVGGKKSGWRKPRFSYTVSTIECLTPLLHYFRIVCILCNVNIVLCPASLTWKIDGSNTWHILGPSYCSWNYMNRYVTSAFEEPLYPHRNAQLRVNQHFFDKQKVCNFFLRI